MRTEFNTPRINKMGEWITDVSRKIKLKLDEKIKILPYYEAQENLTTPQSEATGMSSPVISSQKL